MRIYWIFDIPWSKLWTTQSIKFSKTEYLKVSAFGAILISKMDFSLYFLPWYAPCPNFPDGLPTPPPRTMHTSYTADAISRLLSIITKMSVEYDCDGSKKSTQGAEELFQRDAGADELLDLQLDRVWNEDDNYNVSVAHLPAFVAARKRAKRASRRTRWDNKFHFPQIIPLFETMEMFTFQRPATGKPNPLKLRNSFKFNPRGLFKMFLFTEKCRILQKTQTLTQVLNGLV